MQTNRHTPKLWLDLTLFLALAIGGLLFPQAAWACGGTVICVDADASGSATGLSWTDAYTNVQDALNDTNANGSTHYEIWVAEGVYYPDEGANTIADSEAMSFTLRYNNVQLYGGFAGGESTRDARDWETHLTILSGDVDNDDTNDDGNFIAETWDHIQGGNADHVLWLDGVTNENITGSTVIDGFTITAGEADGIEPHDRGGGLYCDSSGSGSECSPTLCNVTFSGNKAQSSGGGMLNGGYYGGSSNPTLTGVTFNSNWAGMVGGGMANMGYEGSSAPELVDVAFSRNEAVTYGGGMYNYGYSGTSSPTLTDVVFTANTAKEGGGMVNFGHKGANIGNSSPALSNVIFNSNQASEKGGGMYNFSNAGTVIPILNDVIFSGNQAKEGGGMHNNGSNGNSSPTLTNVVFRDNQAIDWGGGLANYAQSGLGNSNPVLKNVTIIGNQAPYGGGVHNKGFFGGKVSPVLTNVIIWGNTATTGQQFYNVSATPILSYTLIQSGTNEIYNDGSTVTYGAGILTRDPQFVDPDTGDYRLGADSPAIDTGHPDAALCPAADLDGRPRADLRCDMGAYERQYGDGDTVIKSAFTGGVPTSFGPTWISMTLRADDPGTLTVTKHLAYPGGAFDAGEMKATWWITGTTALGAGHPLTLSVCYTETEVAGLNEADLRAFRWDGAQWTVPISDSLTVHADDNCVTLTGVEPFGAWTLQDTSGGCIPTALTLYRLAARGGWRAVGLAFALIGGGLVFARRRRSARRRTS